MSRVYLGMTVHAVTQTLVLRERRRNSAFHGQEDQGVFVTNVEAGTPAAKAGLRAGTSVVVNTSPILCE